MRACEIIQRQFQRDLQGVHLARMRLIFTAVFTLMRSGRLSLTCLGRAIATATSAKHGIKRIDRLLGNQKLHAERITFYRTIARRLIAPGTRPVIVVDWTSVTPKLWALVAAVCFEGRALIVYAEVHPIRRYLKPHVNARFLRQMKTVVPAGCAPIIVTDAGFRTPWMVLVRKLGWDYVGRLRHARIRFKKGEGWTSLPELWALTRTKAKDFGRFELGERIRYPSRLVGIRKRNPILINMLPNVRGFRTEPDRVQVRRKALQPWILATSLDCSPERVVAIYRLRMQIEETFRDAKSSRFGLCMMHARTSSPSRAEILILLASIAHFTALLVGLAAESLQLHVRFQANTVRTRRVLSLPLLGRLIVATANDRVISELLRNASAVSLVRLREVIAAA